MSQSSNIEFIIKGKIGENDISTDYISLPLLSGFTKDITDLINSIQDESREEIIISLEKGSLKINALIALATINILSAEIKTLNSTNDLSSIDNKRSKIIEEWVKKTKTNPDLTFEIRPSGYEALEINSASSFNRSDDNIWLEAELFLYGVVTDLGGSQRPNIHLKVEDGSLIYISCTKDDLENETINRVYHSVGIHVLALQNIETGEIKDAKFSDFIDYEPIYDEHILLATIEQGRNAWSDVTDHIDWVRKLRTDNE